MMAYEGWLCFGKDEGSDEVLFLEESECDERDFYPALHGPPLGKKLEWITGKIVSVSYWICDAPMTLESARESFIRMLIGVGESEYEARYSEITGYLWTDETLNIGGHDFLAELKGNVGKWLILDIKAEEDED